MPVLKSTAQTSSYGDKIVVFYGGALNIRVARAAACSFCFYYFGSFQHCLSIVASHITPRHLQHVQMGKKRIKSSTDSQSKALVHTSSAVSSSADASENALNNVT